mmetsp:Transcript_7527/g.13482  ORF Transcript_7527/g.13482 Transcript_7527/m.13482 type:complete len:202 (+) Transcript_7527:77-682(+)
MGTCESSCPAEAARTSTLCVVAPVPLQALTDPMKHEFSDRVLSPASPSAHKKKKRAKSARGRARGPSSGSLSPCRLSARKKKNPEGKSTAFVEVATPKSASRSQCTSRSVSPLKKKRQSERIKPRTPTSFSLSEFLLEAKNVSRQNSVDSIVSTQTPGSTSPALSSRSKHRRPTPYYPNEYKEYDIPDVPTEADVPRVPRT